MSLKRDLGEGYTVQASLNVPTNAEKDDDLQTPMEILRRIRVITPGASMTSIGSSHVLFHLKSKDTTQVEQVLQLVDELVKESLVVSYDILGTTIEDIFLDLMAKHQPKLASEKASMHSNMSIDHEKPVSNIELSAGQPMAAWQQAVTIFVKRTLISRRSWLVPLLSVLVAVAGSTIPLVFIAGRQPSCVRRFASTIPVPLFMPISPFAAGTGLFNGTGQVLNSPPGLIQSALGTSTASLSIADVADNASFVDTIRKDFRNLPVGGLSMDLDAGTTFIAWEASAPGYTGLLLLNLATNILFSNAQNVSGTPSPAAGAFIQANYELFPQVAAGTLVALKWVAFFGATMVS